MTDPILQGSNWLELWSEQKSAGLNSSQEYEPIQPYRIPFIIDVPIIALQCLYPQARDTWFTGGWVSQVNTINGLGRDFIGGRSVIPLNKEPVILVYGLAFSQYELKMDHPPWLAQVRVTLWTYIGDPSNYLTLRE